MRSSSSVTVLECRVAVSARVGRHRIDARPIADGDRGAADAPPLNSLLIGRPPLCDAALDHI